MSGVNRFLLSTSLLVGLVWHADIRAQDKPAGYPVRPIRIIVPVLPGGGLDTIGRAVAQMLTERWGQTVVVDNRPGGGTVIATELGAKAAPDGYTILAVGQGARTRCNGPEPHSGAARCADRGRARMAWIQNREQL